MHDRDFEIGLQFNRCLEIRHRTHPVAENLPGHAAVVVGQRQRPVEPDRLVEIGDGAPLIALEASGVAAIEIVVRARLDPDRIIEVGDGPRIGIVA